MPQLNGEEKNELVMKLLHYFITIEGYNPIVLHGAESELWLENLDHPYKIIRIVSNYIHNNEQLNFDIFKTQRILSAIKKKTLSFKMKVLSIYIDLGDNAKLESNYFMDSIYVNDEKDFKKYDFVMKHFPSITSKLKHEEKGNNLFLKITTEISKKNEEDVKKANDIFLPKNIYFTFTLIMLNIMMFIMMEVFGKGSYDVSTLLKYGALSAPFVRAGEYFRLLTSAFLHVGILHLFLNCYALYVIGSEIETFYGKAKFLAIYLFSAITGGLMSMIFTNSISAGASGAIFGLLGSLLYFGYHYRIYLGGALRSQIIPVIILNLILGFAIPGIDNSAHIGGLIGGLFISMALGVKHKNNRYNQINGIILTLLMLIFLIFMAFIYAI